ncbi:MAG: SusC/RagA family TonB-linked outer membrane protein [Gemmatimonadetes bacterium]|nr:SusC/RagA family TonB-linked outer membrane protein [Gemmatimonadota bacterium]
MSNRNMRWLAALSLVVGLPAVAVAQSATLTGKVTTESGVAMFGAAVALDGMNIQVGSNQAGVYTLTVPAGRVNGQQATLLVRAIGYAPQRQTVTLRAGSQTFDFVLKEDVNRLNQVVVTGVAAGTEQKKLPFTVAQVTEADMPVPGANVLNNLQGKIPGATVMNSGGRPGSAPAIMLRAPQSLNASAGGRSQEPLLIVDGVVQQGSMRDIDPTDIENVEVVKGAAASTLYGSRAAQGVIQITTKSGKNRGEGVTFSSRFETGASDIEGTYLFARDNFLIMSPERDRFCVARASVYVPTRETQDCLQTMNIYDEALRVNETSGDIIINPQNFLGDGGIALAPPALNLRGFFQVNAWPTTFDPVSQVVTNGPWNKASVDMTGKFGRSNFFTSLGDERQRGAVVYLDGLHRNNVRLNVDQTMGGNWTTAVRTYYARTKRATGGDSFFRITRQSPFADLTRRDKFGRLFVRSVVTSQGGQNQNPIYSYEQANSVAETDRFVGSAQVRWQPMSWLDGSLDFGYDRSNNQDRGMTVRGYRFTTVSSTTSLGSISRSDSYSQSYNVALNWTARRDLLSDLTARLTLRSTYEQQDSQADAQSGANLAVPGVTTSSAAIANQAISSSESTQRAMGFVGSLNLDYKDRYIAEFSGRRDGLSVFGAANRWQTYGRASAAWRFSEEGFYPGFLKSVNDFKFRFAVGQAGNRPGNTTQYETFTIGAGGVLTPATLGNKNLRPEVATETEAGIDLEILNKYGVTLTYARAVTTDQVLLVVPPAASGFNNQWRNAGTLEGTTWETSVNIPIMERRDFTWSSRVNADRIRSKISALDIPPTFYGCGGATCKYEVGIPFPQMWGRRLVQSCAQLPSAFVARCGEGQEWQKNDEGLIVWVGQGNTYKDGITKNLWQAVLPAAQAPWGMANSWGMPLVVRDDSVAGTPKPAKLLPIGHALPDLRWSVGNNVTWKKLSAYVLMDAVKGKDVYNEELHWSRGDFATEDSDQGGKTVETAKPLGYYWRVGAPDATGVGGLYDVKTSAAHATEDASYLKIREISVGYRLGKILNTGDWTVSLIGRNLKTWSNYRGFDPEVGAGGGNNDSAILNASDSFGFPNLRSVSVTFTTSF